MKNEAEFTAIRPLTTKSERCYNTPSCNGWGLNGFWKPSKYLNLKESAPEDDQEECIPEEDEASQCETEGDKPKIAYGSIILVKIWVL